ncbi:hypothetical protein YB2330_001965 [Saitoella coloradoensis]
MNDFIAGYLSGIAGLLLGSPLDIIKVRLQARTTPTPTPPPAPAATFTTTSSYFRGILAPLVGLGALNALLFVSYNKTLQLLSASASSSSSSSPPPPERGFAFGFERQVAVYAAGAVAGLTCSLVTTPTELVKCRTQLQLPTSTASSIAIARGIWRREGVRGFYRGTCITSLRDAIGYGFYFWGYEGLRGMAEGVGLGDGVGVLVAGGLAGCLSWASILPLDVVKTRVQTLSYASPSSSSSSSSSRTPLLGRRRDSAWHVAKVALKQEGPSAFFRGMGVTMVRAFMVNGVTFGVYEWVMAALGGGEVLTATG